MSVAACWYPSVTDNAFQAVTGLALTPSSKAPAALELASVRACAILPRYLSRLTMWGSDYVNNNPSAFVNAYWDIKGVRVYE